MRTFVISGRSVYFLVHDLLPIQFPHYFLAGAAEGHHQWLSVVSQSDGVICVSRTVADQYVDWLAQSGVSRLRPLGIGWSHNGADLTVSAVHAGLSKASQAALAALGTGPSFLMVGTIEPRKGHAQVLAAFEKLWDSGHDLRLVIVGRPGWMVEALLEKLRCHPKLGSSAILVGGHKRCGLGQDIWRLLLPDRRFRRRGLRIAADRGRQTQITHFGA